MTAAVARPPAAAPPPPVRGRWPRRRRLAQAGVIIAVAVAVGLRFWARSPLWLDEAQSVAIARLPLRSDGGQPTLWTALRQDGSPPLYYLMLHAWIGLFGSGTAAVRALSGVISLACAPLLWLLASRLTSRLPALATLVLFASSPFAVRYATEARMYSLLVLLTLIGALALERVLRDGPQLGRLALLATASGALALTHYWSFYTLFSIAVVLAVGALRNPAGRGRACRLALLGLASGAVLFVPWLPSFSFQLQHTGTPWGEPAALSAVVHAFGEWAGGATTLGRMLLLVITALLALAVFGAPAGARYVLLDLRGREPGRLLLAITLGTLIVAVLVGMLVGNAWANRYTASAFVPFLLLAGLGVRALDSRRVIAGLLTVAALLGLAASAQQALTTRTPAAEVATAVGALGRAGDVVLTCPDQLGPALARLVRPDVRVLGVPTLQPADRVIWVDYAARQQAADPAQVAAEALAPAGPRGQVFLAVAQGYRTYETLCPGLMVALQGARPAPRELVVDGAGSDEGESLLLYQAPAG